MNEWKARRAKYHYIGHDRFGDAFPEFLVLWALFPILFFSFSRSKLPGYILPSLPPITILTGDYLNRIRQKGLQNWLLLTHALLAGVTVALVLIIPWHILHPDDMPPARTIALACTSGLAAVVLILVAVGRFGVARLRVATILPMIILLGFIFGIGPVLRIHALARSKTNIELIDFAFSARPLARIIDQVAVPGEPVAVYKVRRDVEYGLSFYRNHRVLDYDIGGVPGEAHILVVRDPVRDVAGRELADRLAGRDYRPLFSYPAQHLSVYQVSAATPPLAAPLLK